MTDFQNNLVLLIIDKVIIGGLAFLLWRSYSKKREEEKEQQLLIRNLEEQKRELLLQKSVQEVENQIKMIEEQIESFFWPIHLALKTDDAVWHRVPSLYDDGSQLPTETGELVERDLIIPNHVRAVEIIQNNFHLIGDDNVLVDMLVLYIRHVAVFRSLRLAGADLNPIDVEEPFPPSLSKTIETRLAEKQKKLKDLNRKLWKIKAEQ